MKRFPPLPPLQAFLAVAHEGSFCTAAEHLNLSQSTISRQVERLEQHFSCRLFDRHTRQVTLTARGHQLVPFAEKLLQLLEQTERALNELPQELTVRVHPTMAMRWLLPRLPDFRHRHPEIALSVDTRTLQIPDFFREEIDCMIDFSDSPPAGYHADVLWDEKLTPVCQRGYLERGFPQRTLLHTDADGNEWGQWATLAGLDLSKTRSQFFDMLEMTLLAARQGQGVALADLMLCNDMINDNELERPFQETLDSGLRYWLVMPAGKRNDPVISIFRLWLLEQVSLSAECF